MRGFRLFERPLHVFNQVPGLYVTGSLPSYQMGMDYEGRLDIVNGIGKCTVEIIPELSDLPLGTSAYVDNFNKQVVITWPAYIPPTIEHHSVLNGDFELGTLEGWTDVRGNSWGVERYDETTPGFKDRPYAPAPGNMAAYMRGVGRGEHVLESQKYEVTPGQSLMVRSLWYQGPSNKDNNNLWTGIGIWRNDYFMEERRGDRIHDRTNKARHWSTLNTTIPATATHITVRLIAHRRNKRNREIVVDDVEATGVVYHVGVANGDDYFITLRVRDSANREALWSGPITYKSFFYTSQLYPLVAEGHLGLGPAFPTGLEHKEALIEREAPADVAGMSAFPTGFELSNVEPPLVVTNIPLLAVVSGFVHRETPQLYLSEPVGLVSAPAGLVHKQQPSPNVPEIVNLTASLTGFVHQ